MFYPLTKKWFEAKLGKPTPVQLEAWPAINNGSHVLVSAPTGTGKTLSAFLIFIDRLKTRAREGTLKRELSLIYISPLKSLAGDIRENLKKPLDGITAEEKAAGVFMPEFGLDSGIAVSVRTGDTPTADRRRMTKTPPHILITTPESLYLLLSSASGRNMLKTAESIILDELHAMIDTKRGAHLMLSLARLDVLCGKPLQRIGLSATIEPLELAAAYLSPGGADVAIAAPKTHKDYTIAVTSPIDDMHILPQGTIWPEIARAVYEQCEDARSVIVFVDGRMYSEKLAYYVNAIAGEGFARTHHGCVSKEQRRQAEDELRSGKLRLLCATSSMELGIDVGDIDKVVQIAYPRSISSVMQRLGRAGHNPGRVSVMHMFPRTATEGLYCGLTARVAMDGGVERSKPPTLCFDVLAQHLVSMAAGDGYGVDDVLTLLSGAYPFRDVTKSDIKDILAMLSGDYEHQRDLPVRPRILYDRINERVEGDAYSRMLAVSTGGTIPDTGMFAVKTENNVKLGELDEEFVFEARVGDKFLLGSFAWKIARMDKDTVTVTPSTAEGAQPPFWRHFYMARKYQTGIAFGRHMAKLTEARDYDGLINVMMGFGMDEPSAVNAAGVIERQIEATGVLPDHRTIILEHFSDEAGDHQLMVHSIFGRQINAPLAILMQEAARRTSYMDASVYEDDDGILLMSGGVIPDCLIQSIPPESARPVLEAILPATPLFHTTFRYNAARALLMGVRKGHRQPLWVQRLRGAEMLDMVVRHADHPLMRETRRECLEDYWDLPGLEEILGRVQSGEIQIRELYREEPSPFSLPLRRQAESNLLYEYHPTTTAIGRAAEEALKDVQRIKPAPQELARAAERSRLPEDERALHSLLMMEGDALAGEIGVPHEWFESLAAAGRALYIEPGLWIAAEQAEEYETALEEGNRETRLRIVRRVLRYRGPQDSESIAGRYFWYEDEGSDLLNSLVEAGQAVADGDLFYHADLYERAMRETVWARRKQARTVPAERYAALLASKIKINAPAAEQLEQALRSMLDKPFPIEAWESSILPARVTGYRGNLLDNLLTAGGFYWCINDGNLAFHAYDNAAWDADLKTAAESLDGDERIVYETLLARGASFATAMSSLLDGRSPHDALFALMEKGLAHADSFVPVRQWLNRDKTAKVTARQRVNARVMALTSGRWELSRPRQAVSLENAIHTAFDRHILLCRETAVDLGYPWSEALEKLRVWEFTGQVRRGYFVEGLSGAQFIRESDYTWVIRGLDNTGAGEIVWLPASDPRQPWGRIIRHKPDRSFICVAGSAVSLMDGVPVALFERSGQLLRVFDFDAIPEALSVFTEDYNNRRLYPGKSRLTVKEYPAEAAEALSSAGFSKVMMDYMLHQKHL